MFFSGDLKKEKEKSSENYQWTGYFQSFFNISFLAPHPKHEKKIP